MTTRIKLKILPLITAFSVPYLDINFLVFFSQAKHWKKIGLFFLITLPVICISQKLEEPAVSNYVTVAVLDFCNKRESLETQ